MPALPLSDEIFRRFVASADLVSSTSSPLTIRAPKGGGGNGSGGGSSSGGKSSSNSKSKSKAAKAGGKVVGQAAGMTSWKIALIVIGSVLFILLVITLVWIWHKKKKEKAAAAAGEEGKEDKKTLLAENEPSAVWRDREMRDEDLK